MTYWMGTLPETCDTCGTPIIDIFYDAKTKFGPWGCMCPTCQTLGPGLNKLGTGLGQEYKKQADGRWLKTAG
jgi:hypothetical protein